MDKTVVLGHPTYNAGYEEVQGKYVDGYKTTEANTETEGAYTTQATYTKDSYTTTEKNKGKYVEGYETTEATTEKEGAYETKTTEDSHTTTEKNEEGTASLLSSFSCSYFHIEMTKSL